MTRTETENNETGKEINSVKNLKVPASALCFSEEANIFLSDKAEDGKQYFSMSAYSGKLIKGHSYWGDLAIDVSGIKFRQKRIPILEEHDLGRKLGISNSLPNLEGNQIVFDKISLLNNEYAQEFKQNLDDGFPYQASISIKPTKVEELEEDATAEVNGYKMKGPGRIIRESFFREASACVFGADHRTAVQSLSDEEIEVQVELIESKNAKKKITKKAKGEKPMDFSDIKESNPDLYDRIIAALTAKDTEIKSLTDKITLTEQKVTDLEKQKTDLSAENTENEKRIAKLEAAEAKHKEKELKDQAGSIVAQKLSESKLPQRIQKRVQKQLSHYDFVSDTDELDVEKFTAFVDQEIASWKEDFADTETSTSILGLSGTDDNDKGDDSEDLSDKLVAMATS